jgi:hypothetical protein
MDFIEATLKEFLYLCKDVNIKHLDPGSGVILRHDIDGDFPKSHRLAILQNKLGIKATYFVLDTKPYFKDPALFPMLREMQEMGHEIGWHNDALSQWFFNKKPLNEAISEPLEKLRGEGLNILGTAAHGNRLKWNFVNWDCWDISQTHIGNPQYSLEQFGLKYESLLTIPHTYYINDNSKKLSVKGSTTPVFEILKQKGYRILLSLHPQYWQV